MTSKEFNHVCHLMHKHICSNDIKKCSLLFPTIQYGYLFGCSNTMFVLEKLPNSFLGKKAFLVPEGLDIKKFIEIIDNEFWETKTKVKEVKELLKGVDYKKWNPIVSLGNTCKIPPIYKAFAKAINPELTYSLTLEHSRFVSYEYLSNMLNYANARYDTEYTHLCLYRSTDSTCGHIHVCLPDEQRTYIGQIAAITVRSDTEKDVIRHSNNAMMRFNEFLSNITENYENENKGEN